ncbi:MAG: diguanylate cyclase [Deltaproteobacteria bacterium]|nr:diguanylate cyclase [Deltaproteobacteria bacterium]
MHKVLIADDDLDTADFLSELIRSEGINAEAVSSGREVLEKINDPEQLPDLFLLDVIMPDIDGIETCKRVKSKLGDRFIPIILITSRNDVDSKVRGLRSGADDYLCKPVNNRELMARVRAMLRIKDLQERIRASRKASDRLSSRDPLTGVLSHYQMTRRLDEEFKRAERYSDPLSCLLLGLDGFKKVNRELGEEAGDRLLKSVAELLKQDVREIDIVTRFGGDRFLIILPKTHFSGTLSVAERIWNDLNDSPIDIDGEDVFLTASMGISFYPSKGIRDKESLLRFADRALSRAKDEGGNRICLYQHFDYFYQPSRRGRS